MIVGDEVVIVWLDGHESYYPGEALRKACTCAACKGEQQPVRPPDAAGVQAARRRGVPSPRPSVWSATTASRSPGATGHEHGIYHLGDLRAACPCGECREPHASDAGASEA